MLIDATTNYHWHSVYKTSKKNKTFLFAVILELLENKQVFNPPLSVLISLRG